MKLFTLVVSICMLLKQNILYALMIVDRPPSKSIVLKLPNNEYLNWKEISRSVTKTDALVEYIPLDQTTQNWSEILAIQFHAQSKTDEMPSIEIMLNRIRDQTFASYPGNKVTWRIIEKNKQDYMYEWILHEPYEDAPPYHQIARIFVTPKGLHRIGFSRQYAEMSTDEREKWIRLLKESVLLVSIKEAASIRGGLSMADRFKDSLDLGPIFQNWIVNETCALDNGYTCVCLFPDSQVPPTQIDAYLTECLEVVTVPVLDGITVAPLFEAEKGNIRKKCIWNVKFHVLKKTPHEIIYYYSHPKDHLQMTAVVRTFIENHGYYSISYKRGLEEEMKKEDVLQWARQLQIIKPS